MNIDIDLTTGSKLSKIISVVSCLVILACTVSYFAFDNEVFSYAGLLIINLMWFIISLVDDFTTKKPR